VAPGLVIILLQVAAVQVVLVLIVAPLAVAVQIHIAVTRVVKVAVDLADK
jgi:hypothetical protein